MRQGNISHHQVYRAAIQERFRVSSADPSAPANIPRPNSSNTRSSSRVLTFEWKKIPTLVDPGEIPCEMKRGSLRGVTTQGKCGWRGTKTSGANLSCNTAEHPVSLQQMHVLNQMNAESATADKRVMLMNESIAQA